MAEIRVLGQGFALLLRWQERRALNGLETDVRTNVRVAAAGTFELQVPGRSLVGEGEIDLCTPPLLREPSRLDVVLETDPGASIRIHHPDPLVRGAIVDPTGRGRTCAGALDLSGRVGWLELDFRREASAIVRISVEIFPSKLRYRQDFEGMLAELGAHRATQVLRLLSRTHLLRGLERRPHRTLAERYLVFDAFFEPLEHALRRVAAQPNAALVAGERTRAVEQVRRADARTRAAVAHATRRDLDLEGLPVPRRLPDAHRLPTFDTPANRFVRHAIEAILRLLRAALQQKGAPWTDPVLRQTLLHREQAMRRWLAQDFLRSVAPRFEAPSLTVQRSPGYRDVLSATRSMMLAFTLLAGELRFDLADLEHVYELWCAVRVQAELEALLGAADGDILHDRALTFRDGTRLSAQTRYSEPGGGPTHTPDLSLTLRRPSPGRSRTEAPFIVLFDAKYRLAWERGSPPSPPQDAINALHRYRDAIIHETAGGTERAVYGGAILFPHPDELAFERDGGSAWRRMGLTGIGAVPLVPSQGTLLRRWLSELVYASPVRLDRLGPRYPALPPPRREGTVLVGPLPYGGAQLAQVRAEGWYHLPADRFNLPAHRPSHLAVYASARAGLEAGISHLWRIAGWERSTGSEVRRRAAFGDGRAGRRPDYWLVTLHLESEETLTPPITGYSWGPRQPFTVPLEVFDLAESTFLLRGDARHVALLRLLNHLRGQVAEGVPARWCVHEPLLFDGHRVGWLEAEGERLWWTACDRAGTCSVHDLLKRPIEALFDPICAAVSA